MIVIADKWAKCGRGITAPKAPGQVPVSLPQNLEIPYCSTSHGISAASYAAEADLIGFHGIRFASRSEELRPPVVLPWP